MAVIQEQGNTLPEMLTIGKMGVQSKIERKRIVFRPSECLNSEPDAETEKCFTYHYLNVPLLIVVKPTQPCIPQVIPNLIQSTQNIPQTEEMSYSSLSKIKKHTQFVDFPPERESSLRAKHALK